MEKTIFINIVMSDDLYFVEKTKGLDKESVENLKKIFKVDKSYFEYAISLGKNKIDNIVSEYYSSELKDVMCLKNFDEEGYLGFFHVKERYKLFDFKIKCKGEIYWAPEAHVSYNKETDESVLYPFRHIRKLKPLEEARVFFNSKNFIGEASLFCKYVF